MADENDDMARRIADLEAEHAALTKRHAWADGRRLRAEKDAIAWRKELERFGVRFVDDDEVVGIYWLPAPKGQPVAGSLREALEAWAAELQASAREQIVDYLRGEPSIAANVDVEGIVADIRALGEPR